MAKSISLRNTEYWDLSCRNHQITKDFTKSNILLVYGSMRTTMKNHHRLDHIQSKQISAGYLSHYSLSVDVTTEICYVIPSSNPESKVVVEAYSLNYAEDMQFIDEYEGHPWCYTRTLINNKCWIYLLTNFNYKSKLIHNLQEVEHGDYVQWKIEKERWRLLNSGRLIND